MLNARVINDVLDAVFTQNNPIEVSHADMLRTYQAAVILAFNSFEQWECIFDPVAAKKLRFTPWIVKNKVTGALHTGTRGRTLRYATRESAQAVADRINRTGS